MYTRKFHTVVFTKRKIVKYITYFISGLLASLITVNVLSHINVNDGFSQIASSNLYMAILESELPIRQTDKFDITNPKSIFLGYSPIFDIQPESVQTPLPTEVPVPTSSPAEKVTAVGNMKISNATSYNVDLSQLAQKPLPFTIDNRGPQVLIVHTHTTESFSNENSYTSSDRTTDETKNITSVGNIIADKLNKNGIQTVHDTTVHDYPSYNGAYTRALATIKENLGKYPSIKIVLDVHRDGIVRDDGTKVKVITQIENNPCAQVMIVAGSNASGLSHDSWQENMKFAAQIQKTANDMYPTLMRPLNLREERFNTHMTKGSLILEIGSNGNTLDEAKKGAECIADVICKVLKN